MKRFLLLFVFASAAVATPIVFLPGPFVFCESPNAPAWICATFVPGHETYTLSMSPTDDSTVAFRYTVDGIVNEQPYHFVGLAVVQTRYTGHVTTIAVETGGLLSAYTITVDELVVTSTDAVSK